MQDSSRIQQMILGLNIPESCQDGFKAAIDAITRCDRYHERQFTAFLDPETIGFIKRISIDGQSQLMFFGGYDDAEYQMLGVFAPHETPSVMDFPMTLLGFNYTMQFGEIGHKDVLGSLMALGVERKVFGDILVNNSYKTNQNKQGNSSSSAHDSGLVQFFVKDAMLPYVLSNLEKVRHMGIQLTQYTLDQLVLPAVESRSVSFSVASLRLDAVVSAAFNMSRNQAILYIKQGYIKCNYSVIESSHHLVKCGDLISARRLGRFTVGEVTGLSKKGKLRLSGQIIAIKN